MDRYIKKSISYLYSFSIFWQILLISIGITSCASYDQFKHVTEDFELPNKVFNSTYDETWKAVIQVMKGYGMELQNQESGVIKTIWTDNTLELNFADAFDNQDAIKSAKFKLIVNVIKGFRGSREVTKVTIYKKQLIENDFLQGQKVVPSDGIQEKTLLYRIEQTLKIEARLKKIDEARAKKNEAEFGNFPK